MSKPLSVEEKLATMVAVFLVLVGLGFYLFPWFIPFIWELPRGMTAPYYGILIAIELSPLASRWRENLQDNE